MRKGDVLNMIPGARDKSKSFEQRANLILEYLKNSISPSDAFKSLAMYLLVVDGYKRAEEGMREILSASVDETNYRVDELITQYSFALSVAEQQTRSNIETKKKASSRGKAAAEVRFNKPGGAREKRDEIRAIWASGKYDSRDRCADEEHDALQMARSTARRALRGTPNPS